MTWCRAGDKPLREQMKAHFTSIHMHNKLGMFNSLKEYKITICFQFSHNSPTHCMWFLLKCTNVVRVVYLLQLNAISNNFRNRLSCLVVITLFHSIEHDENIYYHSIVQLYSFIMRFNITRYCLKYTTHHILNSSEISHIFSSWAVKLWRVYITLIQLI